MKFFDMIKNGVRYLNGIKMVWCIVPKGSVFMLERINRQFEAGYEIIKQSAQTAITRYRIVFCVTLVTGLLSYGFIMTNVLNNYDNIACTPGGYGTGISSGRWFLTVLGDLVTRYWGNYTLPLFNGMIAVILISVSACIVISVLHIRSAFFAGVWGMIFMAFPTLAATMLFMYTVHYYAFAVFLIVFGVYVGCRNTWGGTILAAFCFAFSMGIYQAYLPIAISLYLLVLLRKGLSDSELSGKQFVIVGIRYLTSLLLGLFLYFGILHILLLYYDVSLGSYQGVNRMGIQVNELPEMIKEVYTKFFTLSCESQYSVNITKVTKKAFGFSQIVSAMFFVYLDGNRKICKSVRIWNIIIFILFPVGCNSIILMCFHSWIYVLMTYGIVTVFLLPIVLLELACLNAVSVENKKVTATNLIKCASGLLIFVLSITAVNYVWSANGNYVALYYANRQAENYFSGLVDRIRGIEGYSQELPLAIVGEEFSDVVGGYWEYSEIPAFRYGGNSNSSGLINAYSRKRWLSLYLGFNQPWVSREELADIQRSTIIQEMPCYPDEGSIRVLDDVIVIKIEDNIR